MMLFALAEPEEGDAHNVFVDGMLMSPGSEDYKMAPEPRGSRRVSAVLDSRVQVSKVLESWCWFQTVLRLSSKRCFAAAEE